MLLMGFERAPTVQHEVRSRSSDMVMMSHLGTKRLLMSSSPVIIGEFQLKCWEITKGEMLGNRQNVTLSEVDSNIGHEVADTPPHANHTEATILNMVTIMVVVMPASGRLLATTMIPRQP